MAKKKTVVTSDFEEIKQNKVDFEFDDEDFEKLDDAHIKRGRRKHRGHIVFFLLVFVILAVCVWRIWAWNKGSVIDIDPNADTSEFDTEPNDYIQPLTSEQIADKPEDGVLTILTIGNSTFADDYANNKLANALKDVTGATIINAGMPDSMQSRNNPMGNNDNPIDNVSLVDMVDGLLNGNMDEICSTANELSAEAGIRANSLKNVDMANVDCVVISYDISDYIDHRNIYNPFDDDDETTFCGALSKAVKMIQEKYPYIRIVVISPPAAGKTIDDYYVDGTVIDLANGTLNDYIGQEVATCATTGVSYIDIYFGVVNVDTRDQYLVDDYHLNEEGARAVAERFAKLITLE